MDLNEATAEQLERSALLTQDVANEVIKCREIIGGFKSWNDVKAVPLMNDVLVKSVREGGFTLATDTNPAQ